jgi:NADH dehydrogenase FAD-containing subunit
MSKSSENIVLVGAGSGGYLVYRELSVKLANTNKKLIVIEPRKFYVHLPSTLRMVVTPEGGLENKSIMDHPSNVNAGNTKFIYAKVTSIVDSDGEGKYVTLDNGETVEFAVLILATGSRWSGATAFGDKKEEILESVYSWRDRFRDAKDIVLIGGGAVGLGNFLSFAAITSDAYVLSLELAGEIKDEWPVRVLMNIPYGHFLSKAFRISE